MDIQTTLSYKNQKSFYKKPIILIVDDFPVNLKKMHHILKQDYEVISASNGKEALIHAHSKEKRPDLILLDIEMPEMDGYEVCNYLKSDPNTKEIAIIFVTALDEDEDELRGLKLGAADYITKPIKKELLKARISIHLELKRQKDCLQEQAYILKTINERLQAEIVVRKQVEQELERRYLEEKEALSETIERQSQALELLEKSMPGISKLKRDEKGVIILDDVDDLIDDNCQFNMC
ncbi:MAG: response regulator [Desulfobacterales bacterium]|nr:response regulator [Desulfobacterales bacterium]